MSTTQPANRRHMIIKLGSFAGFAHTSHKSYSFISGLIRPVDGVGFQVTGSQGEAEKAEATFGALGALTSNTTLRVGNSDAHDGSSTVGVTKSFLACLLDSDLQLLAPREDARIHGCGTFGAPFTSSNRLLPSESWSDRVRLEPCFRTALLRARRSRSIHGRSG